MLKQTKKFIGIRQEYSSSVLEVVDVDCIGGGIPNDCMNNSLNNSEELEDVRPVTGWVIFPSDDEDTFEVIQHWWNRYYNGKHFDTTPTLGKKGEYVMDLSLFLFAKQNYDLIESIVASSLQFKNGKIIAVDEHDSAEGRKRTYRNLHKLDNHSLFGLN